jgi:hypothetical protein
LFSQATSGVGLQKEISITKFIVFTRNGKVALIGDNPAKKIIIITLKYLILKK